jgi:hypothetical protein
LLARAFKLSIKRATADESKATATSQPHQQNPSKNLDKHFHLMSAQTPHNPDPPIYKHLSPKTQGFLRASASQREEAARFNDDTMSDEQTCVQSRISVKHFKIGGVANYCE